MTVETGVAVCPACALAATVFGADVIDGGGEGDESVGLDLVVARIGRYRLLEQIGEGGFGVVYLAEQEEPVRRKVALKLIKPGMDSRQVIARFEAERQALAMMDHPNIAKVFDAGTSDSGRPYFVMELVPGVAITEFCNLNHLDIGARLELFMTVCKAVQHAHQKGVIHRDLKPSNLLVTLDAGKPVPKVIDFGVAKALNQRLTAKTLFTGIGQMIGTPAYMSPEQAKMSEREVDTRSDIYSLGVLLYELLSGQPPFPDERLRSAGWAEMVRIITDEEPDRPSTRLRTRMLSHDRTSPEKTAGSHLHSVASDLDWIAMRCLEKDPARRYETANGLAADIRRHLEGDPVEAAPPTAAYRCQKILRKHRKTFATGIAFVIVLVAATVVSITQAVRAEREAATAKEISEFLVNDLLDSADPYGTNTSKAFVPGRELRVITLVERSEEKLSGDRFRDQPVVEASLRLAIGSVLEALAFPERSEPHLRRAKELFEAHLGFDHPFALRACHKLEWALIRSGRAKEALQLREKRFATLVRLNGADDREALLCMADLASSLDSAGQIGRAVELAEEAVERGRRVFPPERDLSYVLEILHNRYLHVGRVAESEPISAEILEIRQRVLGPLHPETHRAMGYRAAHLMRKRQDLDVAEQLLSVALENSTKILGPSNFFTLQYAGQLEELRGRQ